MGMKRVGHRWIGGAQGEIGGAQGEIGGAQVDRRGTRGDRWVTMPCERYTFLVCSSNCSVVCAWNYNMGYNNDVTLN